MRFSVHVQPRASRTEIAGIHGDALKVRLQAAPVAGAANDALIQALAAALGVSPRQVRILSGATGRAKVVQVHGVDAVRVQTLVAVNAPHGPDAAEKSIAD